MDSRVRWTRRATRADLPAVVETLSRAFYDDPTWSWAFPDPDHRLEHHALYWRFFVEQALRFPSSHVIVTEGCEAAAVWLPPGEPDVAPQEESRVERLIERLVGDHAPAVIELVARFGAAHPANPPHYYLSLLGVHDDHRGNGIGMRLLAENLERFDREGVPTYLESSNSANDFRYERLGYRRVGEFTTPDDQVVIGCFWRDPGDGGGS